MSFRPTSRKLENTPCPPCPRFHPSRALKLDGTLASLAPRPRSRRETLGGQGPPFPPPLGHYESNFAGLNVHEPPPHPRQHVWMPGTGALSDFSRGPSRQHSLHHLARLSRDDEAMMCPSAQIQVTLPARTPGPPTTCTTTASPRARISENVCNVGSTGSELINFIMGQISFHATNAHRYAK